MFENHRKSRIQHGERSHFYILRRKKVYYKRPKMVYYGEFLKTVLKFKCDLLIDF